MEFIKQNFMDIQLDVLVGHTVSELYFIASQVAMAAGLKNPATAVKSAKKYETIKGIGLGSLIADSAIKVPLDSRGQRLRSTTVLVTEAEAYAMLLRGHAPQSEPFRQWVTEEVLPSLRKRGSYELHTATTPKALQIGGDFAALHAKIHDLESTLASVLEGVARMTQEMNANQEALVARLEGIRQEVHKTPQTVKSPYEATTQSHLVDKLLFDNRTFYQAAETLGLGRPAAEKMIPYVLRGMEVDLIKQWKKEDGRPLQEHVSGTSMRWTLWPSAWAKAKLDRAYYREMTAAAVSERLTKI